jgi:dihydrofolate reductase
VVTNGRVKAYKAIAAMAENRVIGAGGKIPWHLPADFRWFKQATLGHILVMGRKTFESIGRPLPGRETMIMSQSGFTAPGTRTVRDAAELAAVVADDPREVWVAGGAEIYSLLLPQCSDLFLTRVKQIVPGDAMFPAFEDQFTPVAEVINNDEFTVVHYQHRSRLLA